MGWDGQAVEGGRPPGPTCELARARPDVEEPVSVPQPERPSQQGSGPGWSASCWPSPRRRSPRRRTGQPGSAASCTDAALVAGVRSRRPPGPPRVPPAPAIRQWDVTSRKRWPPEAERTTGPRQRGTKAARPASGRSECRSPPEPEARRRDPTTRTAAAGQRPRQDLPTPAGSSAQRSYAAAASPAPASPSVCRTMSPPHPDTPSPRAAATATHHQSPGDRKPL